MKKNNYLIELAVCRYGRVIIKAENKKEAENKADKIMNENFDWEYGTDGYDSIKKITNEKAKKLKKDELVQTIC